MYDLHISYSEMLLIFALLLTHFTNQYLWGTGIVISFHVAFKYIYVPMIGI